MIHIVEKTNEEILYSVVGSVSFGSILLIVILIYVITKCSCKQGKTKTTSVPKDYSQAFNLGERIYDEIDENQMVDSFVNETEQSRGNECKNYVQSIEKETRNRRLDISSPRNQSRRNNCTNNTIETSCKSYENLKGTHLYEQFRETHVYEQSIDN